MFSTIADISRSGLNYYIKKKHNVIPISYSVFIFRTSNKGTALISRVLWPISHLKKNTLQIICFEPLSSKQFEVVYSSAK